MKIRHICLSALSFLTFDVTHAQDLGMKEGYWKLDQRAMVFGTPLEENTTTCSTPADLSNTVRSFKENMISELFCEVGTIRSDKYIHRSNLTCPSNSPFLNGEARLIAMPETLMFWVDMKGRGENYGKTATLTLVWQRLGPCPN